MMSMLSIPGSHFPFPPATATQTFYQTAPAQLRTSPISTNKRKRSAGGFNHESTSDDGDSISDDEARSPTTTTWKNPHPHPPYTRFADGRPLKRIRRDPVGGCDDAIPDPLRRNLNAGMENGFAEMRIAHGQSILVPAPISMPLREEEELYDIKMSNRTWFEPEKDRIVVFDLEDSDDEPSGSGASTPKTYDYNKSSGAYSISQAYLDKVPAWPYRPSHEVVGLVNPPQDAGALVLYKTPAFVAEQEEWQDDRDDRPLYAFIEEVNDDGVDGKGGVTEDVEMMDLDDGMP